jgi:hypothetical protein
VTNKDKVVSVTDERNSAQLQWWMLRWTCHVLFLRWDFRRFNVLKRSAWVI